jgi:hypothetical protein
LYRGEKYPILLGFSFVVSSIGLLACNIHNPNVGGDAFLEDKDHKLIFTAVI